MAYKTSIRTTLFRLAFGLEAVMPVEFQVPSLRIQLRERLNEKESEEMRLTALCELEEQRLASILHLELEQRRRKAFVDRHRKGNEKMFEIGKPVLVFQTRMGKRPGKLRFRWTGPYWLTREYNGSYQLGTLAGEVLGKWVNGFRLKPYRGPMPKNPFRQQTDTGSGTGTETGTSEGNGNSQDEGDGKPVTEESEETENRKEDGKGPKGPTDE